MRFLFQLAAAGFSTIYLLHCCVYLRRRGRESWEHLIGQRGFDWTAGDLAHDDPHASTARGVWIRFRRAGIVLRMADYADRNGRAETNPAFASQLSKLRRNAMQIRVSILRDLAKCTLSR